MHGDEGDTRYMQAAELAWCNGLFLLQKNLETPIMNKGLHYGAGAFEGIRFYNTIRGPAIFRLREHLQRFFYSCAVLGVDMLYREDYLVKKICHLIYHNDIKEGYIRPIMWFGAEELGVSIKNARYDCAISLYRWEKKTGSMRVVISPLMRIHPKTTDVAAKLCGTYNNSILALNQAQKNGFDDAILLNCFGNVAEASASNIFRVRKNVLVTPPLGTILPGITRDTMLYLAKHSGYKIHEAIISPKMLFNADEIFLCGTAMEITQVKEICGEGFPPWHPRENRIFEFFSRLYHDTVHGKAAQSCEWLTYVNEYC